MRRVRRPVVPVVVMGRVVVEVADEFLGLVGCFLRVVRGLFCPVGLLFGAFGAAASLLGGGAGLVGAPNGLRDGLLVAPLVGEFGRFLGQVGGLFRLLGGLLGAFGALARLLGQVARVLGQPASLVGLLPGFGLAVVRVAVQAGVDWLVAADVFGGVVLVFRGVALVLHRVPGHAVGFAGLGHALAGGDLPGLVLSHDRFFPGEAARVCSPW